MPQFVESGECPVHAHQCGDEEQELSDEDEHRFVDDAHGGIQSAFTFKISLQSYGSILPLPRKFTKK